MSQYVVWFDSSEVGAPILNNTAGSLIGVLDACLVNGFNLKSVTSLVVAGGVATATCNSHGYSGKYSQDIVLAGCNTAALNGRKQLTYVDTNTFRFDATGVADQTATGTITAKRDALGWVKQFTGTNKAIYKRSDPTATAMMLRVLDTAVSPASATSARAFMVESATDIDTYTGQGPTQMSLSDGTYINRGENNTTAKQWSIVGDGRAFYLMTQVSSITLPTAGYGAAVFFFGDFKSFVNGDAYNTWLVGGIAEGNGTRSYVNQLGYLGALFATYNYLEGSSVARRFNQAGSAIGLGGSGLGGANLAANGAYPAYPSVIDGGFVASRGLNLCEMDAGNGNPLRGQLLSYIQFLNIQPMVHYQTENAVVGLPGVTILAIQAVIASGQGTFAIDITGPW